MPGTGSSFRDRCYDVIRRIPAGRVMTYGDVALAVGKPGAARAVGTAMRLNPDAPRTPCHRVVASDGRIGEYSGPRGQRGKVSLLRSEGVPLEGNKIMGFEKVRWTPLR